MSAAIRVAYYLLSTDSSVTDIVSTRIYPVVAAQDAGYPMILIRDISRAELPTQDSDSAIDTHRLQINLFAEDTSSASAVYVLTRLARYVREALARVTGSIDGIRVTGIQSAGAGYDYDEEQRLHTRRLDFLIQLTNPI